MVEEALMDVMSVSEAWAYASNVFNGQYNITSETVYSDVARLMEANGWKAITDNAGNIKYYTRPAQAVLDSGVKAYTEVAEITSITTESGGITGATVTAKGIGVSVGTTALACATAAAYGYNIGTQLYEVNPTWWDGLLKEVDDWTLENVPESGVNAIVTVLKDANTVLTFPESLLNRIKAYSINSGAYVTNTNIDYNGVEVDSDGYAIINISPLSSAFISKSIEHSISLSTDSRDIAALNIFLQNITVILNYINKNLPSGYNAISVITNNSNAGKQRECSITIAFMKITSGKSYELEYSSYHNKYYYSKTGEAYQFYFSVDINKLDEGMSIYKPSSSYTHISFYFEPVVLNSDGSLTVFNLNCTVDEQKGIKGTSLQEDATYPEADSPISTTYPDWWNKGLTLNNGSGGSSTWLPMSITDKNAKYFGDTQTQSEAQSGTQTKPDNNQNIDVVNSNSNSNKNNNPDSTDSGNTPLPPAITTFSGIAGVYNPTQSEIKAFANWLWSENPITQLQQMFNNPMNGIIGLHQIYVTPHTSEKHDIGVGYLSSGIKSLVVDEQFVTIDCGTVNIPSYYNNVNDWSPYTKISCYLPFIGIVALNVDDLMSSYGNITQLNITYKIDVLTGACLCSLGVKRGSSDAILYQYNGSCSVQLPLTSGNYGSIITSLVTTAVGVIGGAMPVAIGGAMSLMHSKANISRSGQLGANVGAMGIKKPYIIIERPYSKYAGSYPTHIGFPSNNTVVLGLCSGYTRVKATDVNTIEATSDEQQMILTLLKEGVYI